MFFQGAPGLGQFAATRATSLVAAVILRPLRHFSPWALLVDRSRCGAARHRLGAVPQRCAIHYAVLKLLGSSLTFGSRLLWLLFPWLQKPLRRSFVSRRTQLGLESLEEREAHHYASSVLLHVGLFNLD